MQDFDPFEIRPSHDLPVKGKYKLSWIEESLVLGDATQEKSIISSGTSHIGSSFSDTKFFYVLLCVAIGFSILMGRLLYVQILQGNVFQTKAENNRQRILPILSERGLIFDAQGKQLTHNIPNFSLTVIPQDLPRDDDAYHEIIQKLSTLIHIPQEEITETINKYRYYRHESISIQEDLDYETALRIQIVSQDLPGIHIQRGSKRLYDTISNNDTASSTQKTSLAHILGYVGKLSPEDLSVYYDKGYLPSDVIGKTGVEKTYESYMRGSYGRKRIEVNAQGKEQTVLAEEAPIPGEHIQLHIDIDMQEKMEEILAKSLKEYDKVRGSAVVINPQDGAVLALVSLPSYNNNDFSGGIDTQTYQSYISDENRPLFNRAISGNYPSGSVIKPAIASAALQEHIIDAKTTFLSTGGLAVGPWFFPDWKIGGHGITDVRKSIAWSINTFYYYIGGGYGDFVGLGVRRIAEYLLKFGFATTTGIDIPSEGSGFVPSAEWKKTTKDEPWYVGDTYNLSIGQGDFLTTPLQIAMMTATIANGGTLYEPHIVDKIIDADTAEETTIEPHIIRKNFIDYDNIFVVKMGMKDCVVYGSCWYLRRLPYESGGKTGTAQWSSNKDTHAWFTSFAPFDNPQVVVVVMIEEGGEGGTVAEPIAGRFLEWWTKNKMR